MSALADASADEHGFSWSVFPARERPQLKEGDVVYAAFNHERATVLKLEGEGPFAGRAEVQYQDGTRYHSRPGRLHKVRTLISPCITSWHLSS